MLHTKYMIIETKPAILSITYTPLLVSLTGYVQHYAKLYAKQEHRYDPLLVDTGRVISQTDMSLTANTS